MANFSRSTANASSGVRDPTNLVSEPTNPWGYDHRLPVEELQPPPPPPPPPASVSYEPADPWSHGYPQSSPYFSPRQPWSCLTPFPPSPAPAPAPDLCGTYYTPPYSYHASMSVDPFFPYPTMQSFSQQQYKSASYVFDEMHVKKPKERLVHPDCVNKFDPYHECTGVCYKKIEEAAQRISVLKAAYRKYNVRRILKAVARVQRHFLTWQARKNFLNMRRQAIRIQAVFRGRQARRQLVVTRATCQIEMFTEFESVGGLNFCLEGAVGGDNNVATTAVLSSRSNIYEDVEYLVYTGNVLTCQSNTSDLTLAITTSCSGAVTRNRDQILVVWNPGVKERVDTLHKLVSKEEYVWKPGDGVLYLQFSNNGKYLASSSKDRFVILWEVQEDRHFSLKHKLSDHQTVVVMVCDPGLLITSWRAAISSGSLNAIISSGSGEGENQPLVLENTQVHLEDGILELVNRDRSPRFGGWIISEPHFTVRVVVLGTATLYVSVTQGNRNEAINPVAIIQPRDEPKSSTTSGLPGSCSLWELAFFTSPSNRTSRVWDPGDNGSIHLWGTTIRIPNISWLKQYLVLNTSVCFSPLSAKIVSSVGLDKNLYTYDSGSRRLTSCTPYEVPFSLLAYSNDGNILGAGTNSGHAVFYDIQERPQPMTVLNGNNTSEAVASLCWQRSKPVSVYENNGTPENALLGGISEDSVLMPGSLPSIRVSNFPSAAADHHKLAQHQLMRVWDPGTGVRNISSTCPVCHISLSFSKLEWHANIHFVGEGTRQPTDPSRAGEEEIRTAIAKFPLSNDEKLEIIEARYKSNSSTLVRNEKSSGFTIGHLENEITSEYPGPSSVSVMNVHVITAVSVPTMSSQQYQYLVPVWDPSIGSFNIDCLTLCGSCYPAVGKHRDTMKDYDVVFDLELGSEALRRVWDPGRLSADGSTYPPCSCISKLQLRFSLDLETRSFSGEGC